VEIRPETLAALVGDIAGSLDRQGIRVLVLANAHLDPSHVSVLREAAQGGSGRGGTSSGRAQVIFPDVTRRRWAERLTEEFRSGACHAGRYESSIVLAEAPERVRDQVRMGLEPVPHSLSRAIREGKRTFQEVGGPRAYFGAPAEASAQEGRRTVQLLGRILEEATWEALGEASASGHDS